MPTGYTSDLYEGKPVSFEDFVLRCARIFGALVTMRDQPLDAEIPDKFEPRTDYYDETIIEQTTRLHEAQEWSEEEAQAAADEHFELMMDKFDETVQECDELRERYESMIEQVKSWTPPTDDHARLKRFMIEQLEESIKFDCSMNNYSRPVPKDGEQYREEIIENARRRIDSAAQSRLKEIELAKSRTEWIRALRDSLVEWKKTNYSDGSYHAAT